MGSGATAMAEADYIAAAASGDQFEIQSSQIVLERSTNEPVKRFAGMMVEDHRASTERLTAAAKEEAMAAPPQTMTAAHQARLDALRAADKNTDRLYLIQQREAHAEAIALHRSASTNSAMPEALGAFARDAVPRIEDHARMLSDIGAPGA
jgi:putative membrane protein